MKETITFYDVIIMFIIPIITLIISGLFTKHLNRKRDEKGLKKIDLETTKLREEIKSIKSSFQPIVLSTIQRTQDHLLEEKIEVLKSLIKMENDLSYINQDYIDGQPFIGEISEYYNEIYKNYDGSVFKNFEQNIFNKRYFFNDTIIKDIQKTSNIINTISDQRKKRESINPTNYFIAPKGFVEQMDETSDLLDSLINKIRTDLHLNNNYIHEFIKKNGI